MEVKDWEALDARPTPEWFKKAKFGIFIHWGLYSVPAFAPRRCEVSDTGSAYSEWYGWFVREKRQAFVDYHRKHFGNAPYEDFANQFRGKCFDPEQWADLFQSSGAKYVIAVSKHHDSFTLFDSAYNRGYGCCQLGPKRDVLKELFEACDRKGIIRGAYYSLLEWPFPVFTGKLQTREEMEHYARTKMLPELKQLVEDYRIQIVYADGEWGYPSPVWHSREFLTWLFEDSSVRKTVAVNDRWGNDCRGVHGGYFTREYGEVNSGAISEEEALRNLRSHYWEECRGIGCSFGYNRNEPPEDYLSGKQLIELLIRSVSEGGNLCLNVGPKADGTIPELEAEQLRILGKWLEINGEAIFDSETSPLNKEGGIYRTRRGNFQYLFYPALPQGEQIVKAERSGIKEVRLLGTERPVRFRENNGVVEFGLSASEADRVPGGQVCVVRLENA